jgi:hypothetical protein
MAIIMSQPMTAQEIRVLQEFRRLTTDTLSAEAIRSIRHPVGGGEEPAQSLVTKGYLTNGDGQSFVLAQKGKEFIAIDVKPDTE